MTPYNITHCGNGHLIFEQVASLRDKPEALLLQLNEGGEKPIPTLYLPIDALENWKMHHDLVVPEIPCGHTDLRLTFLLSDTGSQQFAIIIFASGTRALLVPVTPLQMLIPPQHVRTLKNEIIPILHHSDRVYIVPDAPVSWRMSRADSIYFGFREQNENGLRQLIFDVGSPMFRPAIINGVAGKRTTREHGDRRASGETGMSVKSPRNPYSLINYPGADGVGRWLDELGESMAYGVVLGVPTAFLPDNALGPWREQMSLSLPGVPTTGEIELAFIVSGQQFFAFLMFGGIYNNKLEKRSMAILLRITPLQMMVAPRAIKTRDGVLHQIKVFWDKVFNVSTDGVNQRMRLGVDGGQSGVTIGMDNVMTCTVASAFMRTAVVQSW